MTNAITDAVWDEVHLRDICERIDYGFTASANREPVGPKFLRITDIVPDLIDWSSVPYCSLSDREAKKYRLEDGDIVIARTGATTGYAKYIHRHPESVFASYLVRIRVKPEVDARFVGQIVQSNAYKEFIKANLGGSAQPQANAQILTSFPLRLPPLPIQRRVADILTPYDDLIENNTRRIAILEEMARALYREWFVEFRFPRHEGVRMVESAVGPIPEGWNVEPMGKLCSRINSGGTPSRNHEEFWEGGHIPWFKTKELTDSFLFDAEERITEEGYRRSSAKLFPRYTVLLAIYGATIGKLGILTSPATFNQAALGLVADDSKTTQHCVFYALEKCRGDLIRKAQGAAQQNISKDVVVNHSVLLPSRGLVEQFSAFVGDVWLQIERLQRQNLALKRTRDLLLPKLVTGEIDLGREALDASEGTT